MGIIALLLYIGILGFGIYNRLEMQTRPLCNYNEKVENFLKE